MGAWFQIRAQELNTQSMSFQSATQDVQHQIYKHMNGLNNTIEESDFALEWSSVYFVRHWLEQLTDSLSLLILQYVSPKGTESFLITVNN